MSYNAIVTRLQGVRPHPNADRVKLATCCGNQVVIGLDEQEDALGVYFSTDGQLSDEFCKQHNLYRDNLKNRDKDAKPGMFDDNRRVRTQKFRGEISDGFWVPLHFFDYITTDGLDTENFEFCDWQGHSICNKYVSLATVKMARENQGKKTKTVKKSVMFKEHFDTAQFGKNLHVFTYGQYLIATEKMHGCVTRSTLVETLELGEMTIGEIVDKKLQVKIKAFDTETDEIVFVPIDNWFFSTEDEDWYDIELEDGRVLTITGNNPVWLPELNCYRKVKDLTGDEKLLID